MSAGAAVAAVLAEAFAERADAPAADGLRPIRALDLPTIKPAADVGSMPEITFVDPTRLLVDDRYQRGLSQNSVSLIRKIVREWNWGAFKPPIVARVPEGLKVVDGQHTAIAAATHPDIRLIPIVVLDGRALADQADLFVRHNRDRVAVTSLQLFHARLAAGDPDALEIDRACRAAGATIVRSPRQGNVGRVGEIIGVAALRRIFVRRGTAALRRVVSICVQAKLAPVPALALRAVETLTLGPQRGMYPDDQVSLALRVVGPVLDEAARELAKQRGLVDRALAAALVIERRLTA